MTRFLSEVLVAPEPHFRLGLQRLEAATGHPNHDIRLSAQIQQQARAKLLELGLDSRDTTPQELYHVLQERIKADDARLVKVLRTQAATHINAEADVIDGMVHSLRSLPDSMRCFALKSSALKALLKKQPPKKAMKQLGYRSVESFLKHENAGSVLAAATLSEGPQWHRKLLDQYKRLQAGDFENRTISIIKAGDKRWQKLAKSGVTERKHNILSFPEIGAIVLLPLPTHAPAGSATISLGLALHELNRIRASSTFLKLCQVRGDFGTIVKSVANDEARLSANLLDQPVSWQLIQRYYAQLGGDFGHAQESHVGVEDMVWHPIEQTLSAIEPSLAFWHDTAHVSLRHEGRPVSLNILDAALNYCNRLPFARRVTQHVQTALWQELLLRYLHPHAVEQTINSQLQPQLVTEAATA